MTRRDPIKFPVGSMEPEGCTERFGWFWLVTRQRAILSLVEMQVIMISKNLRLFVEPFANAKVYVRLSHGWFGRSDKRD